MLDPSETIAAIASPRGPAERGIVRLSGPEAIPIGTSCFDPTGSNPADRDLTGLDRPAWILGRFRFPEIARPVPGGLAVWPGSRTYTGQPSCELNVPGAPVIVESALAHCLLSGARLAKPGEFTLRAFLADRLDLTQAEAVLGTIDARSDDQLRRALDQLAGGLGQPLRELRDRLLDVLAHLEATLDFVDEPDVKQLRDEDLAVEFADASLMIDRLLTQLGGRHRTDERPRVVLVGPPNAGKSRLFNALIDRDLALVSDVAGTTRDYLSAPCHCVDITIELIDTAGLDRPVDEIDALAQQQSRDQLEGADLLLDCRSPDQTPMDPPRDGDGFENAHDIPRLLVWTKADLGSPKRPEDWIETSIEAERGLDTLRQRIAETLTEAGGMDAPTGTAARCRASLEAARDALARAAEACALGLGDELVAIDLRHAIDGLGDVVGAVVTDDLLDRIFGRFCIGK